MTAFQKPALGTLAEPKAGHQQFHKLIRIAQNPGHIEFGVQDQKRLNR
jgi:hypothetical protein